VETQFRNIDKVGLELEGAFKTARFRGATPLVLTHDGSVREFSNSIIDTCRTGEVISPPLAYWGDVVKFIQDSYPDSINRTCGMHVHISVPSVGAYEAIADQRFHDFLMKSLKIWGKKNEVEATHSFWRRLAGTEFYCRNTYRPDEQIPLTCKSDPRYSQINYCYSLHKTMEIRVLPMFKQKKLAISAVYHLLRMTNKYLGLPGALKAQEIEHEFVPNFTNEVEEVNIISKVG
jgi:hypothetical protein